jgi:hypothetical protein
MSQKARHSEDCSRRLQGVIGCRCLAGLGRGCTQRKANTRQMGEPDECAQVRGMVMQGGPTCGRVCKPTRSGCM